MKCLKFLYPLFLFMVSTECSFAQITAMCFNAEWNAANKVDWFGKLSDCDLAQVDIVKEPIQQLVKFKFQKMFMEDKLYTALPNLTSWLITSFNRLNNFANRTHK